jgi:hypothetical protein
LHAIELTVTDRAPAFWRIDWILRSAPGWEATAEAAAGIDAK